MNDFLVTLYKSDNTYLTYPVNGKITILETGTDGRIIRAVFQTNSGGPVVIDHPDFEYPAEQRARWFSEYGDIKNSTIAAAPELLEACRDAANQLRTIAALLNHIPKKYAAQISPTIRYADIDAAIAKAETTK